MVSKMSPQMRCKLVGKNLYTHCKGIIIFMLFLIDEIFASLLEIEALLVLNFILRYLKSFHTIYTHCQRVSVNKIEIFWNLRNFWYII